MEFYGEAMKRVRDYFRVKQAAELLGVSPNTLRNWSRGGKIPVYRNPVNGYRLFARSGLMQLLKKIDGSVRSNA